MSIEIYHRSLDRASWEQFARMNGLTRLLLDGSRLDPDGFAAFCQPPPLDIRTLFIGGTGLAGAAPAPLQKLAVLAELRLNHDQLTSLDVGMFPESLQMLAIHDGDDSDLEWVPTPCLTTGRAI